MTGDHLACWLGGYFFGALVDFWYVGWLVFGALVGCYKVDIDCIINCDCSVEQDAIRSVKFPRIIMSISMISKRNMLCSIFSGSLLVQLLWPSLASCRVGSRSV